MYSQNLTMNDEMGRVPSTGIAEHSVSDKPNVTLDLGSTGCPMFGLKSMKALRILEPGQTIEITTTNSRSEKALGRVSWMTSTKLIAVHEEDGQFKHLLRKG
jgi:TusA-related sulfurtransferase